MQFRARAKNDVFLRGCVPADFQRYRALLFGFDPSFDQWWPALLSDIVRAVDRHVDVMVVVPGTSAQLMVTDRLLEAGVSLNRIRFTSSPIHSIWARDFGPTVMRQLDGDWKWIDAFYGPGARQSFDDQFPATLARTFGIQHAVVPICLENGNLVTNGNGLVICTDEILSKNRRCGYGESHVTANLQRMFNATDVIYLESLRGEPNGHVDWFATFLSQDTVVVGDYRSSDAVNGKILDRNANRLRRAYSANGPLNVVRLPMPQQAGRSFNGTYTNVLFANDVLLVPTWPYADRQPESEALATYQELLPDWKIVPIDATMLSNHGGALRTVGLPLHQIHMPFVEIACDERGAVPA